LVSILIGRQVATLILDTGAEQTVLTLTAAQRLGLKTHGEYPRRMRGIDGTVVTGTADVPMTADGALLANSGIQVGSVSLPTLGYATPDGLLGADILSQFDVDLDLPHGFLHLYQRPSCVIAGPAWAPPYDTIAASRSLHDRLFFPMTLNMSSVAGLFDSGSQHSVVDALSARKIDRAVVADRPVGTVRGITADPIPMYTHRFDRLVVGSETLPHPSLAVAKLDLDDADVIVGMDYLRWHRVWLSYGSHLIFIRRPT
jgi:hypothetical protein